MANREFHFAIENFESIFTGQEGRVESFNYLGINGARADNPGKSTICIKTCTLEYLKNVQDNEGVLSHHTIAKQI